MLTHPTLTQKKKKKQMQFKSLKYSKKWHLRLIMLTHPTLTPKQKKKQMQFKSLKYGKKWHLRLIMLTHPTLTPKQKKKQRREVGQSAVFRFGGWGQESNDEGFERRRHP